MYQGFNLTEQLFRGGHDYRVASRVDADRHFLRFAASLIVFAACPLTAQSPQQILGRRLLALAASLARANSIGKNLPYDGGDLVG